MKTDCVSAVEFLLSDPSTSFCTECQALAVWASENSVCGAMNSSNSLFNILNTKSRIVNWFSGF